MKQNFLQWYINNGGDVSQIDGNSIEPEQPKRQPNPDLKRHNYKFEKVWIHPKYCEAGIILETDPNYIHYIDEPCKVLISEVKIIEKENVTFNKKFRLYQIEVIDAEIVVNKNLI